WSSVDLPTPELPRIARRSRRAMSRFTLRSTSIVPSPIAKERPTDSARTRTSLAARTGTSLGARTGTSLGARTGTSLGARSSLIAERLHRVEARGLPRRQERRAEREHERDADGEGDLTRVELGRQRGELVDAGRQRVDADHVLDPVLDPGDLRRD